MAKATSRGSGKKRQVKKSPTGIEGLDDITGGGLPAGRPTLLCGGAGSGKTLMAMEFIVKGISMFKENGVYLSFEESKNELFDNVASLGFDMDVFDAQQHIFVREIDLGMHDFVESGDYNLDGLFAQIEYGIDCVGAKRIVIDGIETLFSHFSRESIIRKELKRIFRWLKGKGVTALITSEQGGTPGSITRHGIEEYISDCVIILDHRITEQVATRRLHIQKYRGARHGTNEYPFLITDNGISVFPITATQLDHDASSQQVSTGIQKLDDMFRGGYYKGSSILITGTAGTGKSSLVSYFANAVCGDNEKCLYFAFEESARQIVRNMGSIGMDLQGFIDKGLLKIHAARPMLQGLEMHLLTMHEIIEKEQPSAVILDPVSNLDSIGSVLDVKLMFIRVIDYLKQNGITALYTALTPGDSMPEATDVGISSIMDTWILLQNLERNGQRERSLYIMKSRGLGHSNKIRKFRISDNGIDIDTDSQSS
ncbi:MAG TPA: KaiC 1 [Desulfobacteraceae bacterium]|nr:KaiC 1 [Desulfobacteraceae bacterium]